jgi:outer membrane protein assembly factor BamB
VKHLIAFLLLGTLLAGCSGMSKDIFSLPVKNEMPTYTRSNAKHRVLTVLWRVNLVDPDTFSKEYHKHGIPAVSDDGERVFAGAFDGSVYCLGAKTGKMIWRKFTNGPVEGQPKVAGGVVYVGSNDGNLYAFRTSDGELLWEAKMPGSVSGNPVIHKDRVMIMTDVNAVVCLEAQTGKWLWSYRRNIPTGRFQVKGVADPVVIGDLVYTGFSDGYLVALSFQDGTVQNSTRLSGKDDHFTDVDTTPLKIDGNLLTGSFSQGLVSLDPVSFTQHWNYKVEGPSSLGISKDEVLYVSTANSKVVALKAADGKPLWVFNAKKGELSQPAVSGNWILISSQEYSLLVLDRNTGRLIQIFNPGKGANAAPAIHGDRAYWISNGETLYAMAVTQ